MKKNLEVKTVISTSTTAGDLKSLLKNIPDDAKVDVYTSLGDRPWESDTHYLEFNWQEEL